MGLVRIILATVLMGLPAFAQIGGAYRLTAPQRPGGPMGAVGYIFNPLPANGSISPGSITYTCVGGCPTGVLTRDPLYLSGGTGTPEVVSITVSGNIFTFTAINSHSGAWTLQSATNGTEEAALDGCSSFASTANMNAEFEIDNAVNGQTYGEGTMPCGFIYNGDPRLNQNFQYQHIWNLRASQTPLTHLQNTGFLSATETAVAGGTNWFDGTVDMKSNYQPFAVGMLKFTNGQTIEQVYQALSTGLGDTLMTQSLVTCYGGISTFGDEACEDHSSTIAQGTLVYAGGVSSSTTGTGITILTVVPVAGWNALAGWGVNGSGRWLMDTQTPYNSGYVNQMCVGNPSVTIPFFSSCTGSIGSNADLTTRYGFSGASFTASTVDTTTTTAVMQIKTTVSVTVASATGISNGTVLAFSDQQFEQVKVSGLSGSTFNATFQYPHHTGSRVTGGGIVGSNISMVGDSVGLVSTDPTPQAFRFGWPIVRNSTNTVDVWVSAQGAPYAYNGRAYPGLVSSATVSSGGSSFVSGDVGKNATIQAGNDDAVVVINTVSGGAVTGVTLVGVGSGGYAAPGTGISTTCIGCTGSGLTVNFNVGEYNIFPAAGVISIADANGNPSNTFTLEPNIVTWGSWDTVEEQAYPAMRIRTGGEVYNRYYPGPLNTVSGGPERIYNGLWSSAVDTFLENTTPSTHYVGAGGSALVPFVMSLAGPWGSILWQTPPALSQSEAMIETTGCPGTFLGCADQAFVIAMDNAAGSSEQLLHRASSKSWNWVGNMGLGDPGTNPQGLLDVELEFPGNPNGWVLFNNNIGTELPPASVARGLFFGWNYSNGGGESIVGFNTNTGSSPYLSLDDLTGTTLSVDAKLFAGSMLAVNTIEPLSNPLVTIFDGINFNWDSVASSALSTFCSATLGAGTTGWVIPVTTLPPGGGSPIQVLVLTCH